MNDNNFRENMYRLLASVFIKEIDEPMLKRISAVESVPFSPVKNDYEYDFNDGFQILNEFLDSCRQENVNSVIEDLAAEYARIFLAAGEATGKAAFPYESVYAGFDSKCGGSIAMQLKAAYLSKGLKTKTDMFAITEDHVGLILNYMAELIRLGLEDEQKEFYTNHLKNWCMKFADDVYKISGGGFYQAMALLLTGLLKYESAAGCAAV